ncbi:MAG: hypothetical protein GY854_21250 [Deltaproteobacteria bacterium]|nr:hypothetical protein [Deltaproteobacteria bacterium]
MSGVIKRVVRRVLLPWRFIERFAARSWYSVARNAVFAFSLCLIGAASALVILEPWVDLAPPVEQIQIGRLKVATGVARSELLLAAARARLQSVVSLRGQGFVHRVHWADLGATVDLKTLDRILIDLAREDSSTARYFRDEFPGATVPAIPLPITLGQQTAVEALVALKDVIDRKPKGARFDFDSGRVVEEEPGRSLDVYGTLAQLDWALAQGAVEVEMAIADVPAPITREDLVNIKADTVVGFFETRYSRMRKDRDRTHNVRLGASQLDGQVIMPGRVFSLNDTLGDRSEARGFRYAPVIAAGVLVEGMGGGTCQIASTLNAAAFFAGLVVVERRPHSRPSSYIKLGLDATVSYPALDLKLRNPFEFPVVIHFVAKDGVLRAEIRGRKRPYTVTFLRRVVGKRPFPVRVIDDSKLARGKEVITQNGIPGYTVRRYQIIERDKVGYRFQTVDKYPPTTQFIHRGIGDPGTIEKNAKDTPKPDMHKPYHASTYLRMVQGLEGLWYEQSHE